MNHNRFHCSQIHCENIHFPLRLALISCVKARNCNDDQLLSCTVPWHIVVGAATNSLVQKLMSVENMMSMAEIEDETDSIDIDTVVDGVCILAGKNMVHSSLLSPSALLVSMHRICFAVAKHLIKCK